MAESKRQLPRPRKQPGDEADVTAPHPHRVAKPPPMFVQDKDRWTELRRRCADKEHTILASAQFRSGIEVAGETVADFKICKTSLGESLEIPVDEVKEDLVAQNLPVQSVAPNTEPIPKTLDLVLVSGTAEANDKATATFFKSGRMLLSGVKRSSPQTRLTRAVSQLPVLRALVPLLLSFCALREMPGGPYGQLPWMPACSKETSHEKAVPREALRAVSAAFNYARAAAGPRNAPAAAKNSATSADDLSQLMSITVIDTSELMILAKIPCRREPDGKLLCLVEHASLMPSARDSPTGDPFGSPRHRSHEGSRHGLEPLMTPVCGKHPGVITIDG
ncbi:hypothetical protein EVAR_88460_1 [Eumeta japonica]|uniref:Uncharacterized protein n=1 Tax=Eumeta variegata TaxID=151549 RepID=A0A4C1XT95_EUMVA|nr:hypothetical protein EVAR_88460_1 [Eumeta japonica]